MYQKYYKRLFDIILSLALIILLFPIMILIFFFVWILIGYPIFSQKRPGLNNKIFTIYKFKTLYDISKNNLENKRQRQSKFGNFLRKTGLDELPQIINVLQNKMSFVGPRPLLVEYLEKYSRYEKKRHLVKPGITGLAQINPEISGKKSWQKSIKFDVFYVYNINFLLDIKIILKTILLIFSKKKQYQDFKKTYE
jgi:undecaprenyl phosphate N,N'-diacetylbacillosamine 1-phosphate transferase